MMRSFVLIIALMLGIATNAQRNDIVIKDTTTNRKLAEKQIAALRNGTLVVRLKTNDRSIKAYRDAGQTKLADKLAGEQRERNLHLMRAFLLQFDFCDVLFIKATDTKLLQAGNQRIFLNGRLEIDSNIKLLKTNYLFAEYGDVKSNERVNEYKYDVKHTRESNTPTTTSALVILDTGLAQLQEPFPFYTMAYASGTSGADVAPTGEVRSATLSASRKGSIDDNNGKIPFDKAVGRLSKMLTNFYYKVLYKRENPQDSSLENRNDEKYERYRVNNVELIVEELQKLNAGKETFYLK